MSKPLGDDYEVGHKKPPKATQFKKGQSGNPKGRRKGSLGFKSALIKAMNEKITVSEHGKVRRYTCLEALAKRATAKALTGTVSELKLAIGLVREFQMIVDPEPVPTLDVLEAQHAASGSQYESVTLKLARFRKNKALATRLKELVELGGEEVGDEPGSSDSSLPPSSTKPKPDPK